MKTVAKFWLLLALLATLPALANVAEAQLKKMFDPQKVVSIQGEIQRLETITRQGRQAVNNRKTLIAYVKTPQGTSVVHLGPAEFLARQNFQPRVGAAVEITGGRVSTRQGEVILATTVKDDHGSYRLRDNNGIPVWEGQTPGCYGKSPTRRPSRS